MLFWGGLWECVGIVDLLEGPNFGGAEGHCSCLDPGLDPGLDTGFDSDLAPLDDGLLLMYTVVGMYIGGIGWLATVDALGPDELLPLVCSGLDLFLGGGQ